MATLLNLTINSTETLTLPRGTTAQRPVSPQSGYIRYNTTLNTVEFYTGSDWVSYKDNEELYGFTGFYFNNGNKRTAIGPSFNELLATDRYNEPFVQTNNFNVNSGIQEWTVPYTGYYRILAAGAKGGEGTAVSSSRPAGNGAIIRGDVPLEAGEQINIIVGTNTPTTGEGGGGGGGSYVWRDSGNAPLIIAGGGGGNGDVYQSNPAIATGQPGNTGTSGTACGNGTGTPGTNGNGGSVDNTDGGSGAGAGFLTDGADGSSGADGGHSPLNSSSPGRGGNSDSSTNSSTTNAGGFGGGGGESFNGVDAEGGGGGGGYSGGAGSGNDDPGGGGGGSFITSTALNAATSNGSFTTTGSEPHSTYSGSVEDLNRYNTQVGYVIIQRLDY